MPIYETRSDVYNVRDYGAVGDGTTDDGPAFNSAVAAAAPSGTVYVPSGSWAVATQVALGAVSLVGDGQASVLVCSYIADNTASIVVGPLGTGSQYPVVQRLKITGPVTRNLGVRGVLADGIQWTGTVQPQFRDLNISGFDRGMVWGGSGGHVYLDRVTVTDCYYGIYQTFSSGDSFITASLINGNTFANIACPADHGFDGMVIQGTHLGFAPYGIYQEATPDPQGNKNFLSDVILRHCRFEAMGNAAIYTGAPETSPNVSATQNLVIEHPGFSWNATYKIAALDKAFAVRLGYVSGRVSINGGTTPFETGTTNVYRIGNGNYDSFELTGPSAAVAQITQVVGDPSPMAGSGVILRGSTALASSILLGTTHATALKILYGSGSPEGVVAAAKGSLYMRTDGSYGPTLYLKVVGSGSWFAETNTNWWVVPWGTSSGWTAATGTATRTTFATSTVTTEVLAQHLKALIDDLLAAGILGA